MHEHRPVEMETIGFVEHASIVQATQSLLKTKGCNPSRNDNHRHGIRTNNGRTGCIGCAGTSITNRSSGEIKPAEIKSTLADIEKKLNQSAAKS